MPSLAERLEEYRLDMFVDPSDEINKSQMARYLDRPQTTWSGYTSVRPDARKPGLDDLLEIADSLCVTLDWLTGRTDSPKWGPMVDRLRAHLMQLAVSRQVKAADAMERLVQVMRAAGEFDPRFSRPWFMAGVLGISEADYERIMQLHQSDYNLPYHALKRWESFSGLHYDWLTQGRHGALHQPILTEYNRAAHRAKQDGISPEELEAAIPLIKPIVAGLRRK